MSVNYGSKRVVVGAHYGLRDWLSQRVTAVLMALFTLALLAQVIFSKGPIGYDKWAGIFSAQWMKVLTFSVIVAIAWHAWVGLHQARGPASGTASVQHCLAGQLRRLGHPGSVASLIPAIEGTQ